MSISGERTRRYLAAAASVVVGAALLPPSEAVAAQPPGADIHLAGKVAVVRGADADPGADRVVRRVLSRAGVRDLVTVDARAAEADLRAGAEADVTLWLGDGPAALAALDIRPATGLPAEGYVLATGTDLAGRAHVVLDGVDPDGTFYAAQDLQRLVARTPGADVVPAVSRREAPAMRYRGAIEGFYGTPWSQQDRLGILDYLGAHRMNTYEYAPKDDPYHREKWRDPYPADRLADLTALAQRAIDNHVDFTFALSPGLSICYSSEADFAALTAKFDAVYAAGVRAFTIPLDDIDPGKWHCAADEAKYGTGPDAAGRAQADLLNRVQREWVAGKGDVAPLQMVPTEYYNVTESPYKKAIRDLLDPHVVVHWTGIGVIPKAITRAQAAQARQVFGHDILIWDNYPVNDYIAGRIPLGPYTGRENGLSNEVAGVISNPMNQAALSEIALYSFGEYGWDDTSYDARDSWRRALDERAGGDREVAKALAWFADLHTYDTTLHDERAPRLAAALETFWSRWNAGDKRQAAAGLRPTLAALRQAPHTIRTGVVDPAFSEQGKAWLDGTELWARAMQAGLDTLLAVDANHPGEAWASRQEAAALVARAKRLRDTRLPHSNTYPLVADGVADAFVDEALHRFAAYAGVGLDHPLASTSLGTYADNVPARMVDGNPTSYYYSDRAPTAGDHVQVDLRRVRPIGAVAISMGYDKAPNDYVKSGVLEYSRDGSTWTELARGTTAEVRASAPAGTQARYVRYRATADNAPYWLVVREFDVQALDRTTLAVSGTPPPAAGSTLAAAADDDLDTAYVAATKPVDGDALVVALSAPRRLERVNVLLSDGGTAAGRVEVRIGGAWRRVGQLRGGFTSLPVRTPGEVAAVRLVWRPGGRAPAVAEVVPRAAS